MPRGSGGLGALQNAKNFQGKLGSVMTLSPEVLLSDPRDRATADRLFSQQGKKNKRSEKNPWISHGNSGCKN